MIELCDVAICQHCGSKAIYPNKSHFGEYVCWECKATGTILIPIPDAEPGEPEYVSAFEKLTMMALESAKENGYTEQAMIFSKELETAQKEKQRQREAEPEALRENIRRYEYLEFWREEKDAEMLKWGEKLYRRLLYYTSEKDPDVQLIKYELAFCYSRNQQKDRAMELCIELLSIKEWILGPKWEHLTRLLAYIYTEQEQYQSAIALYKQLKDIPNFPRHYDDLGDYRNLIDCYHRTKQYHECSMVGDELRHYVLKWDSWLDELQTHYETYEKLAEVYLQEKQYNSYLDILESLLIYNRKDGSRNEALRIEQEVLKVFQIFADYVDDLSFAEERSLENTDHSDLYHQMICFTTINVPTTENRWTFQNTEAYYDYDDDDSYTIEIKTCHSRSFYFAKRYNDSLKFDLQYLRLREMACGREHDDIVKGLYRLAFSYYKLDDIPNAISSMEEALQIQLKLHGEENELTQKLRQQVSRFQNKK